ncbi:MAG: epimerase [Planctomycetes bacterium]|nr:epimerase [Planctomycetota bacterium]HPF12806.1 epimerase [Planctomycetota bacterium]
MSKRLLILGGTQFVGRHLAECALDRGHEVTLFHRGKTGKGLLAGANEVFGDRDGGLGALKGRHFDWVLDTCGYVPRVVGQAVEQLQDQADHYLFVSTVSVYGSFAKAGLQEGDEVARIDDPETETVDGRTYGALKALCEEKVLQVFGERALIPRPGIVAGPYDPTDRFTYWVRRMSQPGPVLAPLPQEQPIQLIDARDLAAWMVNQVEAGTTGIFNTAGPEGRETFASMLAACQAGVGQHPELAWAAKETLDKHAVAAGSDLPLWLPDADHAGVFQVRSTKARAMGLACRELSETARDTWQWVQTWSKDRVCKVGIPSEREATVHAS